jgi:tripartite-type tricarboxylate transporter receptor subunit TctC
MRARWWALALATVLGSASAQDYPVRPIRLVVPQAPGGSADIIARSVAEPLSRRLGQTVVVENRVGAGGNIGTAEVAKASPDGYTLMLGYVGTLAINPWLYGSVPFDPVESFVSIVGLADVPLLLVTRSEFPARNLDELIEVARHRTLSYGSAGNGTMNHMNGELINVAARVKLQHVPYKGVAFAVTDVLGGQIDLSFASIPSVVSNIKAGRLKALAVSSTQRTKAFPEVPTMLESKGAPVSMSTWYSLMAPRGLSPAIVTRIHDETLRVMDTPQMRERLDALGAISWPLGQDELLAVIRQDLARWGPIVKASGARID